MDICFWMVLETLPWANEIGRKGESKSKQKLMNIGKKVQKEIRH